MSVDPIQDELKDFEKLGKILISKRTIFQQMAIMHGKGKFAKIKGTFVTSPLKH